MTSLPLIDEESRYLVKDQLSALSRIESLVDADDAFKDTARFVAHRILGNGKVHLFLHQVAQLSECGTGWDSSFENGNAQSDRRDDVILYFITQMCGLYFELRLRDEEITIRERDRKRSWTLPRISRDNRAELTRTLDEIFAFWWGE